MYNNTGSNFGENAPANPNAPPSYQDSNGTAPYQNPVGYAPPPNVGGGNVGNYQPPQIGNTQPSYTGPPASNPPQPSYTNPPQQPSYANPPQPSYANPPQQPSYANPPGPTYAQPPVGNPNQAQPNHGPRAFRHSLCDCFMNCKYCLYVFCCFPCALGEMRTAFDGNAFHFWLTVIVFGILYPIWWSTPYWVNYGLGSTLMLLIYNGIATFFLMEINKQLCERLNILKEDDFTSCLLSFFCSACKLSQMGNELTQIQLPEVRELVLNVQQASPCNQACMNDAHLTVVTHRIPHGAA